MEEMLRAGTAGRDPVRPRPFRWPRHLHAATSNRRTVLRKRRRRRGAAKTDLVARRRLGTLLAKHKYPLVVLEACRSATVGKAAVFRSVAPRLIQAGVGSVLSMGHAVHVEAARLLLDRFYRELVRGDHDRPCRRAGPPRWLPPRHAGSTPVRRHGPSTLKDWFLPHLYQRGAGRAARCRPMPPDSTPVRLVRSSSSATTTTTQPRVEALARLLEETHGLRVWLDKWEVQSRQPGAAVRDRHRNSRFTVVVGSQNALKSQVGAVGDRQSTRTQPEATDSSRQVREDSTARRN